MKTQQEEQLQCQDQVLVVGDARICVLFLSLFILIPHAKHCKTMYIIVTGSGLLLTFFPHPCCSIKLYTTYINDGLRI
jgi:hypothetical protein